MPTFNTAVSLTEMVALAEFWESKAAQWAALSPDEEPARLHAEGRAKFWRTVLDTGVNSLLFLGG